MCSGYGACNASGVTTHGYEVHGLEVSGWSIRAGQRIQLLRGLRRAWLRGATTPGYNLGNGGDWRQMPLHTELWSTTSDGRAVAEWNGGEPGLPLPGHVAVVEAVGPHDSYIVISQQHIAADPGGYDWMQIDAGSQSWEPWPDHFIHFLPYRTTAAGVAPTPDDAGYWLAETDGEVSHYGMLGFYGDAGNLHLKAPISGIAAVPNGGGYWLVGSDGGIFSFGDAGFYGSTGDLRLNAPIVGIVATPDGKGYWLVGSDGGIFDFGDAGLDLFCRKSASHNVPIVGMATTPDGRGYWLVGSDGGIFNFGDAGFYGSTGGLRLNARSPASPRRRSERVTGSSAPTAASSTSATPGSTDLSGRRRCRNRSSASCVRRWARARVTGSWAVTAACIRSPHDTAR